MRLAFLAGCIVLAACNTTTGSNTPDPAPLAVAPTSASVKTRSMTFSAENDGVPVAASCTVRGPEIDRSFATPAKLDIPVDTSGRALISHVSCDVAGKRVEASDIPGPETKTVKARTGGTGLFGDSALLFGPSGNIVQYFVRSVDEGVIRVGRAPDP
ncbi:hypothetical protein Q5Y75_20645 [Ruegeria sp. 2205SS24-7]|uniref:hypothetical protein n=1 Tax=Ruegeria discodermiae TaxID=3064389 RepID=UPI002740704B|nr:hypothetical protein [Ruegeria sp. 2205SS24-7]MDP5219637.1 hypothetical protein [Ruegeria sp. 2205SS24-7]